MAFWASVAADELWRNAFSALPLALFVAAACRWCPCRPTTRHVMWLIVLLWFGAAPFLPDPPMPIESPVETQLVSSIETTELVRLDVNGAGDPPGAVSDTTTSRVLDPNADRAAEAWQSRFRSSTRLDSSTRSGRDSVERPSHPTLAPAMASAGPVPGGSSVTDSGHRPSRAGCPILAQQGWGTDVAEDAPDSSVPDPSTATKNGAPVRDAKHSSKLDFSHALPQTDGRLTAVGQDPNNSETPVAAGGWRAQWRRWVSGVLAVRDALGTLSPIPMGLWVAGIAVLVLGRLGRSVAFRRTLASAYAAPRSVRCMVKAAAKSYGLRRTPRVMMVRDRVSPMIVCGRRPQLILPQELWSQLDDVGRNAVIYHELAHVRRRDHWVVWVELVISCLYWWNPLIWWVRRRLHDEAEHCCDAWVTWLLPRGRRAYAEALLTTKQFIGDNRVPVSALGMGMTTGRARRFARRITMVMTENMAPRLSVSGLALAMALSSVGWLATPARACDPKPEFTEAPKTAFKVTPVAPAEVVVVPGPAPSTFERYLSSKALTASEPTPPRAYAVPSVKGMYAPFAYRLVGDDDSKLEKRMERLERRLAELIERLEKQRGRSEGRSRRREPVAPKVAPPPGPDVTIFGGGGDIVRKYELAEGKLEAFTALMARSDVPILVSPTDGGIEVHGSAHVQAIFKAFVGMINSDEQQDETYALPKGKLKALSELMIRSDVPIRVSPGEDGITVYGSPAEQAVFNAFVNIIHPKKAKRSRRGDGRSALGGATARDLFAATEAVRGAERYFTEGGPADAIKAYQHAMAQHENALVQHEYAVAEAQALAGKARHREFRDRIRGLKREMDQLAFHAEDLRDQADDIRADADDLREEADAADEKDVARALNKQAKQLDKQARGLERQAKAVERQARQLENQAESFEEEMHEADED